MNNNGECRGKILWCHTSSPEAHAIAILDQRITSTTCIHNQRDVINFLRLNLELYEREIFGVLFLNNQHKVIVFEKLFLGTIDCAPVYPREVAKRALELNAAALILAHNHPSGTHEPSSADIKMTQTLVKALGLFNIRILDHIIIGSKKHLSFCESGLL